MCLRKGADVDLNQGMIRGGGRYWALTKGDIMRKSTADRKAQLLRRQAALTERMLSIETELDSHHNPDWDDLAIERAADEVLEGLGLSAQDEVRAIEAALLRVEDESYGMCAKCGVEISQERLDVLPYTPFCRDCAALV